MLTIHPFHTILDCLKNTLGYNHFSAIFFKIPVETKPFIFLSVTKSLKYSTGTNLEDFFFETKPEQLYIQY